MGDKGGKKDKEKSKHQHDTKLKEDQKKKQEKNRPKSPKQEAGWPAPTGGPGHTVTGARAARVRRAGGAGVQPAR